MSHEIKLSHLIVLDLTAHDKELLATAINVFGSGDHPVAQVDNLDFFDLTYLLNCLDKGIEKCAQPDFKDEVTDLWCSIHMEKDAVTSAMKIKTDTGYKVRNHNNWAFNAGHAASERMETLDRDAAYPAYRQAVVENKFDPSVSASVCFVAGFLGKPFPKDDDRVTQ